MMRMRRALAALLTVALVATACTNDDEPRAEDGDQDVQALLDPALMGGATDVTVTLGATESSTSMGAGGNPAEVRVAGSPGTTGVMSVVDDNTGNVTALAVVPKAEWRDPAVPIEVNANSSADALVFMLPGYAHPSPEFATILLHALHGTDEYARLVTAVTDAVSAGDFDVTTPSQAITDMAVDAATAAAQGVNAMLQQALTQDASTGTEAMAYVAAQAGNIRDHAGESCDEGERLTSLDAWEADDVCIVQTGYDGASNTVTVDVTNRSNRWVALHRDSDRSPDIMVPPAGMTGLGFRSAPAYADAALNGVAGVGESAARWLGEKLGIKNDRIGAFMNALTRSVDDLRKPKTVKGVRIPLDDVRYVQAVTYGYPAATAGLFCADDDTGVVHDRYYDVTVMNHSTQIVLPAIHVVLDGVVGIVKKVRSGVSDPGLKAALGEALADPSALAELGQEVASEVAGSAFEAAERSGTHHVFDLMGAAGELVERARDEFMPVGKRLCQAGAHGTDVNISSVMMGEEASTISLLQITFSDLEYVGDVVLYAVADVIAGLNLDNLLEAITSDPGMIMDAFVSTLVSKNPIGLVANMLADTASLGAAYTSLIETSWRYEPLGMYEAWRPDDLSAVGWANHEWRTECVPESAPSVVRLTDGVHNPNPPGQFNLPIFGNGIGGDIEFPPTFTDVTGDGHDDAIFVTNCTPGMFVVQYVDVWTHDDNGNPLQLPTLPFVWGRSVGWVESVQTSPEGVLRVTSNENNGENVGPPWNDFPYVVVTDWTWDGTQWQADEVSRAKPGEAETPQRTSSLTSQPAPPADWQSFSRPGISFQAPEDLREQASPDDPEEHLHVHDPYAQMIYEVTVRPGVTFNEQFDPQLARTVDELMSSDRYRTASVAGSVDIPGASRAVVMTLTSETGDIVSAVVLAEVDRRVIQFEVMAYIDDAAVRETEWPAMLGSLRLDPQAIAPAFWQFPFYGDV